MRTLILALALLAAPLTAEAAPLNPVRSVFTLAGAYVGAAGGFLVGTTAYAIADPYGHDNAGEWVLAGGLGGVGLGAALGGGISHVLVGGRAGGKIFVVCGLMGAASGAAALYAPTLYSEADVSEDAFALFAGAAVVGGVVIPLTAMAISSVLGGRHSSDISVAPVVSRGVRGLSLVVRI